MPYSVLYLTPSLTLSNALFRPLLDAVSNPHLTVAYQDLPLFRGITSDLFPGVELPTANYGVLPDCLQVRWPAWKCVSSCCGASHPGTSTPG